MAIVQISRITNRKGLIENLPQLAGGELGWAIDARRLFIGNGTLEQGAPFIGNTEILTEASDIVDLIRYTYKDEVVGYAAQTGPTPGDPVVRTVQAKLDDFADIRDFGAAGDGITDDTAAINRALYQLYCIEATSEVRRSLFFPAGTYLISDTIIIPTFAKLVGEGANCTIIKLSTAADYVARYGDNQQQTGVNIGNDSTATIEVIPPQNIEISSMTFQSTVSSNIFMVDQAQQCYFDSVNFIGSLTVDDIITNTSTDDLSGVNFNSTASLICEQITFDKCLFSGTTYGIKTDQDTKGLTVSNSRFDTLYNGIFLQNDGSNDGSVGFRAVHNMFDSIYAEGIYYADVSLNVSAYNIFLNVGDRLVGVPLYGCVRFDNDNNVSANDLFERSDADALIASRVYIDNTAAATNSPVGGTQLQMGRYVRENGQTQVLTNNTVSPATIFTVNSDLTKAFSLDYTVVRGSTTRHGRMIVVPGPDDSTSQIQYSDDYVETGDTGITLVAEETANDVTVKYTATNTGSDATLTYSLTHLA